jgi:uncharacterized iron-regulated protein
MRSAIGRIIPFFLLVGGLAGLSVQADKAPARQDRLQATLRKLEKQIAAARGLAFKSPVVAKVIARPKNAAPKIQGYYSLKDKVIYLYDDIKGAYRRGVLIHEMVHALQDQHFGLSRLHQKSFGSDAELARAALVEGDATFTMIEVLKKDQPRVAAMLDAPLAKAANLQNAFLYAQGARYVKALKDRGGWQAVNAAYLFPPSSTAAILHPEGVKTIDLGVGKQRGELAIVELLARHPATAKEAFQAAAGWRGDRLVVDVARRSWVVLFGTGGQAVRFQQALAKLRAAQNPRFQKVGANVWHGPKGEIRAVLAHGARVLDLEAPTAKDYLTLLDRLEGPPSLVIYAKKDQRYLTFGRLMDRLQQADLICMGEQHNSEPYHRVQLQVIKGLYARDERLGVGMEMFQRPFQAVIDRYFRGELTEKAFLKASEYRQRWGYPWALYRPIVEFCRRNSIPLAALNAPRELTRRLSKVGYDGLSTAEKKQLGRIDFHVKEHRAHWFDLLARMHGKKKANRRQKERSYQVMTAWDEYMGASAARFQKARGLRRLVILAGSGHIDRGFGIPARAAKRTGGKVVTIHIEVGTDPKKATAKPVADYTVIVR